MQRSHYTWTAAALMLVACGGKPKPEAPSPVTDVPASPAANPGLEGTGRTSASSDAARRQAAILAEAIYFGYDEATLSQAARARLEAKAEVLRTAPEAGLVINGHTDERGSDEYNLTLGMRRAVAAQKYLLQVGVSSGRVEIVSYGEERPAVRGSDESAYSANRRDEFVVTGGRVSGR